MDKQITFGELWEGLGYGNRAAMASVWTELSHHNIPADDHVLPQSMVSAILENLSKPKQGRKKSISEAAEKMLAEVSGEVFEKVSVSQNGKAQNFQAKTFSAVEVLEFKKPETFQKLPKKENKTQKPLEEKKETFAPSAKFLRSDSFLFIALAASMLTQMIHTGGFFFNNSPTQEPELRIIWAAVFAIGVDCTALVMTIRRGGRGFLWAFAGIHFAMNIALHTQVHEEPTWGAIFGYILLSGVIAFSNFSYTDLFRK